MAKVLGSWSGMRKYLEQEMLAECLKNRVRYSCTTFPGMDGCGIFEVIVDDKKVKQFSMETVASNSYQKKGNTDLQEYWDSYWREKENIQIEDRVEYDDGEFSEALRIYRSSTIQDALSSSNPIVKMFAILDRRVGKRTLEKIKSDLEEQPEWLQCFYKLRYTAENITFN